MNFLAHLFLSGDNEEIMLGNMLGDFVRKINVAGLSEGVIKGILLHREIDNFTDNHPLVDITKQRLRPLFSHYSPVVADVYFDHFLAANWNDYSDIPLKEFAKNCYSILKKNKNLFPLRFQQALAYMRFFNMLVSYSKFSGIDFAFNRIKNRTGYHSNLDNASKELKANYNIYKNDFLIFFPELQKFVDDLQKAEKSGNRV